MLLNEDKDILGAYRLMNESVKFVTNADIPEFDETQKAVPAFDDFVKELPKSDRVADFDAMNDFNEPYCVGSSVQIVLVNGMIGEIYYEEPHQLHVHTYYACDYEGDYVDPFECGNFKSSMDAEEIIDTVFKLVNKVPKDIVDRMQEYVAFLNDIQTKRGNNE
jgi:hypothetical protein